MTQSNYEIISIKVWFLPLISIFDMTLLSQYYRYKGYIFTECSLQYEGWYFVENCNTQKKKYLAGFSQRGSHACVYIYIYTSTHIKHIFGKYLHAYHFFCIYITCFFNIYMHVFVFKYTQRTHIYYVNKLLFRMRLIVWHHLYKFTLKMILTPILI